jgi:hypothetical protein
MRFSTFRIAALVALALAAIPSVAVAGQPGTGRLRAGSGTPLDTILKIDRGGVLDLQLGEGEIVVTGWSDSGVRVRATAPSSALRLGNPKGTTRVVVRLSTEFDAVGGVRIEVSVPSGISVSLALSDGNITARNIRGNLDVRSSHGTVEVVGIQGRTTVNALAGDVRGSSLDGGGQINLTDGDVTIVGADGDLSIETISGRVSLSDIQSRMVNAHSVSGDIRYQGRIARGGRYDFSSQAGDVHLVVPSGTSAQLSVQSYTGQIASEFPMTLRAGDATGVHRAADFRIGDGGARITIESFSGSIDIKRGGGRAPEEF